jgi:hypothetical protein
MENALYGSVTRIADLPPWPIPHQVQPRHRWKTGDYVVGEVVDVSPPAEGLELPNGREIQMMVGDLVVGAFGVRAATLEASGSWSAIGEDLLMNSLTEGGLFGRLTSKSSLSPNLAQLRYRGHLMVDGKPSSMRDWVPRPTPRSLDVPVILIVGTSMSAGKTMSARRVVRCLKEMGLRVAGAKLTGAGRWHDVLSMRDAGADVVFDFVDVGLPSSIVSDGEFRSAMETLLTLIANEEPDVLVAEAGASPLEPYNGGIAISLLRERTVFTILCASDPYAVRGITEAFGIKPDLVAGPTANTDAGVALVGRLCGVPAVNLMVRGNLPQLGEMLERAMPGSVLESRRA